MSDDNLRERVVIINVVDKEEHFVRGASVAMMLGDRVLAKADHVTQPAVFHINDIAAVLKFVATYGNHRGEVTLAADQSQHTIRLQELRIVPNPSAAPPHIRAGNPVMIMTLMLAGLFAALCIWGGVQLMSAPGSGETAFSFLGLNFTTKQAGVASIGLGAIVVILVFRRVLRSLEFLGRL
jgi:hypothetical protein